MSVIVTVTLPAAEFTPGAALAADAGLRARLERVVPVGDRFVPYVWVADDDLGTVEGALAAAADVEAFTVVDELDGEALVRVEWAGGMDGLLDAIAATEGVLLEAVGEGERWRLQLRFPDHDRLTAFYRRCADDDIPLEVERVHNPGVPSTDDPSADLTDPQRETLELAFDRGYFEVPRRTNVVELAAELGISDSAVSQRLRRGIAGLLLATLPDTGEQHGTE
jgi:hypothetical protein